MQWHEALKKWSQTSYGIIHTLALAENLQMGNLGTLEDNIKKSFSWISSDLGFDSIVDDRNYNEGSIKLDGRHAQQVVQWLQKSVAEMLLTHLVALCDELLMEILDAKGVSVENANFFYDKLGLVTVRRDQEWAKNAMFEMNAIRNCIIHSASKWNERSASQLERKLGIKPVVGSPITVSFKDIFNYKKAVRVFLGEASL